MKMSTRNLLGLLVLMGTCHMAQGETIVSVGAPSVSAAGPVVNAAQFVSSCWTQQSYSNVSITAPIFLANPNTAGVYHGTAYVTSSIGPGTTSAIASYSFTGSNTSPQSLQLFSGLTLGTGFYCLTFSGTDTAPAGSSSPVGYMVLGEDAPPQVATAPGAGLVGSAVVASVAGCGQSCVNAVFPPFSTFLPTSNGIVWPYIQFSISGQAFSAQLVGSMPQIVSGGIWTTTFTVVNNDTTAVQVVLNFFGDNGTPLTLPLIFPQTSSTTPVSTSSVTQLLDAGAELIIQTAPGTVGQASQDGWAQLSANGNAGGSAVFGWTAPTGEFEAVVGVETRNPSAFVMPFDNTNGYATGIALANLSNEGVSVPVVLRDDQGASLGTASITLLAHGHTNFMLTDATLGYPATAGKRGTLELDTPMGAQISAMGIRANPSGWITSVPTLVEVS